MNKIGTISFLLALVLALLSAVGVSAVNEFLWILAILGVAFAIFSLDESKAMESVIFTIGLSAAASSLNGIPVVGNYVGAFSGHLATFMLAAALILCLRWLWNTGNVMGLLGK